MKLKDYIKQKRGNATKLASQVGTTIGYLSHLSSELKNPSLRLALKIRDATGGLVTPDDFIKKDAK